MSFGLGLDVVPPYYADPVYPDYGPAYGPTVVPEVELGIGGYYGGGRYSHGWGHGDRGYGGGGSYRGGARSGGGYGGGGRSSGGGGRGRGH